MVGIYLLHKILLDNKPDILAKLNRRWFLTQEEKALYVKIKKFISKYGVLPKPDTTPIGFTNEPLEYYINTIKNRYLISLIEKLKLTNVTEENVESIIRKFSNEVKNSEITTVDGIIPESNFNDFILKTVEDARIKRVSGLYGYSTGYPTLDALTGGFLRGDIFVLSARLKKGKTIYMLNMLRKLAKEFSCMLVSMEMSLYSIARRLIFLETKIPQIITANRIVSSFHDEELRNLNLKLTMVNGTVINDVGDIPNYISYYKPEIVFIDGAYLLPTEKKFNAEWERAKYIIEELRRIALLTERPIVCSYQLSRQAVKSKEPKVEHIAFTDAIAQSASVVVAIDDTDIATEKKFYIVANREGESDVNIRVSFDWSNANFEEITDTARISYIEESELEDELLMEVINDEKGKT